MGTNDGQQLRFAPHIAMTKCPAKSRDEDTSPQASFVSSQFEPSPRSTTSGTES
jgi:hypothetical protein